MKTIKKMKSVKSKFVPQVPVNPLVRALTVQSNFTTTENGALTNKSTLNDVLDWFGAGAALRDRTPQDAISIFSKAFAQDPLSALKILFYFRDIREGQGERQTFRTILNWLGKNYPDIVKKNLENIAFFGRWDDYYNLMDTSLESDVFALFQKQLKLDLKNMKKKESISLLAKWMKSTNASSKETCQLGYRTAKALGMPAKKYRQTLSALRKYIDVTEVKMCSDEWSKIDFEKVPSKASLNYRKAFGKHDQERYANYLKAVEKGEKKINAGAVYPYELLAKVMVYDSENDKTVDLQWKAMPNWLEGNEHNGIVIADTSGSMSGLPIQVSVSLAIYFAERNEGPFKDVWINFSNNPTFQRLKGNNLYEKYKNMDKTNWDGSTNLQSAFDLIL